MAELPAAVFMLYHSEPCGRSSAKANGIDALQTGNVATVFSSPSSIGNECAVSMLSLLLCHADDLDVI